MENVETTPTKRGRGRPATGLEYPIPVPGYENEEGMAMIKELMGKRGLSMAALLRVLVREEHQRVEDRAEVGRRLREAAADPAIQEYYSRPPDDEEWLEAQRRGR